MIKYVLAIETSCDDSSVAVVSDDGFVHAVLSIDQNMSHLPFGGVVPEVASRKHTENLLPLVEQCLKSSKKSWDDIHGVIVTARPGLIGSLIVGVTIAKTLSLVYKKPFLGVNHLEGHIFSPFLKDATHTPPHELEYPFLALVVSGGHSHFYEVNSCTEILCIGKTVDDASGEAFDKLAQRLGLGFPGGVMVDQWARQGDSKRHFFSRPMLKVENLDMSFSGLKTEAQKILPLSCTDQEKRDFCASYQAAIVEQLMRKTKQAQKQTGYHRVAVVGGVSANSLLRSELLKWQQEMSEIKLSIPPLKYCTDNAAMIGLVGLLQMRQGLVSDQFLKPSPSS